MHEQAQAWGNVAKKYDELFVDPYHEQASNPVLRALSKIKNPQSLTIGDLGCGTGPFLPWLAKRFGRVVATDFSQEMLKESTARCKSHANITYHHLAFDDLPALPKLLDLAVTINSLVIADVALLDRALSAMQQVLKPRGRLFGIVPSLEGLHYHVMLLVDLGLKKGMSLAKAQKFAHQKAELHGYDFNTATFTFDAIHQHLWLRDEVSYRLKKAGFTGIQVRKATLPWHQFAEGKALSDFPQSWDWAFVARK